MKRFLINLSFALLLLLGSSGQIQAVTIPAVTTIDTTPDWDGKTTIQAFGYPDTATYGQVVTVPVTGDNVLQSFSFYMKLPNTCTFRGYVYAWDGTKATGSALYESPTGATKGSGNFEEVHFETGGVAMTPGAQYVLFASTSKDAGSGSGPWGAIYQDVYPGSGNTFVFLNNGTDTSAWTSLSWTVISSSYDLAFKATFVKPNRKILYWVDEVMGTNYIGEALLNLANTFSVSITAATNLPDFESKVAAGGWDLVVLSVQSSFLSFSSPNFNAYVSKGGKAILADWTEDATRGALFGVTYTGNDNQNVITITDDLLLEGVTNPMSLTSPGWGIFSMGMAGTTGIVAATFPNGDAAIVVGAKGKTIINGFLADTPTSGVALFENEILSLLPLTVTSANGGERVPAGGVFNLTWIPGTALGYTVSYSTKGTAFKVLANQYGNAYEWSVPLQTDNQPNCMIKVVSYGPNGVKLGQDQSDRVFTIEVVKQVLPNGGETWTSGSQYGILWTTNGTMATVANVQLFYAIDGGRTWKTINTLTGNPGYYLWTVPTAGTVPMTKCKVKVVLKDAIGTTLGSDVSDGLFTIVP